MDDIKKTFQKILWEHCIEEWRDSWDDIIKEYSFLWEIKKLSYKQFMSIVDNIFEGYKDKYGLNAELKSMKTIKYDDGTHTYGCIRIPYKYREYFPEWSDDGFIDGDDIMVRFAFDMYDDSESIPMLILAAILSITHECRHVWQLHNCPAIFLDRKIEDVDMKVAEYKKIPSEVDAKDFERDVIMNPRSAANLKDLLLDMGILNKPTKTRKKKVKVSEATVAEKTQ